MIIICTFMWHSMILLRDVTAYVHVNVDCMYACMHVCVVKIANISVYNDFL